MSDDTPSNTPAMRCPTCRKPAVHAHRPFCSKRCADIDLARWLGGSFVIPGAPPDLSDESSVAPNSAEDRARRAGDDAD